MIIANRGGHTNASCGAIGFINELTEDRKVIKRVNELLSPYHTIVDCTPSETSGYGEWNIGVNTCNNSAAEIFFSIHFNAGGGKGCECIKHSTDNKIVPYASAVLGNLSKLGFTNRGVKNNDELAETSGIKCPSMIIEVCFVDTKSDVDLYNSIGVEKIARAIANGIDGRVSLNVENAQQPSNDLCRILVNGKSIIALTGLQKCIDYVKANYPKDEVKIQRVSDNAIVWTQAKYVAPTSTSNRYAENGTFTFNTEVQIRTKPQNGYETGLSYYAGESVIYKEVILNLNGYNWIVYTRSGGGDGFMKIKDLSNGESYGSAK